MFFVGFVWPLISGNLNQALKKI